MRGPSDFDAPSLRGRASFLRWTEGRPSFVLLLGGLAVMAWSAVAVVLIAALPSSSIDVRVLGDGQFSVGDSAISGAGPAVFLDQAGEQRLAVPLADLARLKEPRSDSESLARFMERRNQIAGLLDEPDMRLQLPDGTQLAAETVDRTWTDLPVSHWMIFVSGMVAAIVATWVFVLRPREEGARAFAASGLGYLLIVFTVVALESNNPAYSGNQFMLLQGLNVLLCVFTAFALIYLFARYPLALVPRWVLWTVLALALALDASPAIFTDLAVFTIWPLVLLVMSVGIVGLLVAQAWLTRRDPAMRVAFGLIGGSMLTVIAMAAVGDLVPDILNLPSPYPAGMANIVFMLFFIALGVAVARFRLFTLGQWSVGVFRAAAVLLVVLLVDITIALALGQTWIMSLGLFIAAAIWLPLRKWALLRADRTKSRSNVELVRGANQIGFARNPAKQREYWRQLLVSQFDPLDITEAAATDVEIANDGRELIVPSPFKEAASRLSFASKGTRLFGSQDAALAQATLDFVAEAIDARRAYERGAKAERARISRDLHDDVGARLMTSLHRDDISTTRADVREALSDMRLLIDEMAGQARQLTDVVADLRHETLNRLSLTSIAVDWPIDVSLDEDITIGHLQARAIYSIARELTTNIIRHSGASAVAVSCDFEPTRFAMSFTDNGNGFAATASERKGNGLINARKRIEEIGGTLEVESDYRQTCIAMQIPLGEPQ